MKVQIKTSYFQNRLGSTKRWAVFVQGVKAYENTNPVHVLDFLKGIGVRDKDLKCYARELGVEYV